MKRKSVVLSRQHYLFLRKFDLQVSMASCGDLCLQEAVLQQLCPGPRSALEEAESLEQLRALEHGLTIKVTFRQIALRWRRYAADLRR